MKTTPPRQHRTAHPAPGREPVSRHAAALDDHRPAAVAQRHTLQALHDGPRLGRQQQALAALGAAPLQRAAPEEELPMQGQGLAVQRAGPDEEEPLQARGLALQRAALEDELPVQGQGLALQRAGGLEEELPVQGRADSAAQPVAAGPAVAGPGGLPAGLQAGVEALAGVPMDDVRVHRNSDQPAAAQALAFAQGPEIHLAPGQDKHLPHEAWHVAQQKQGRVQPTLQLASGVAVNDDAGLEREADVMGARALSAAKAPGQPG